MTPAPTIAPARRHGSAAVVREGLSEFVIEDVAWDPPRSHEARIRVVAAGLCHTDLLLRDGQLGRLPAIGGHEGTGIVEDVGASVEDLKPGDPVVLSFPWCGRCRQCLSGLPGYCDEIGDLKFRCRRRDDTVAAHDADGRELNDYFFGQSSFGSFAVVDARQAVKVESSLPLELVAPVACGVQTGVGAMTNSLKVHAGATVVIFGAGSVGLSAVMGARLCGASSIVAVNRGEARRRLALSLGATHAIDPTTDDPVTFLRDITHGRGADYALETTGKREVLTIAVSSLGPLGICGFVGTGKPTWMAEFPMLETMMKGRTIRGILQGDSIPRVFIPRLLDLQAAGQLPFEKLVRVYDLVDLNQAVADVADGTVVKPVVRMPR